jgi:DNA-binding response OmpR family regulator
MRYYISIEKNIEGFEFYKVLWQERGIYGIIATTMTAGIMKAIEFEKTKSGELYFLDIVADDIDYMPQLDYLSSVTAAPILIAASGYDADEHHQALITGADFYGAYNDKPEQNINAVIATIKQLDRRTKKRRVPTDFLVYKDIFVTSPNTGKVFVNDKSVSLTKMERTILILLVKNSGGFIPSKEILINVWGKDYQGSYDLLWQTMYRLRKKLAVASPDYEYIQVQRNKGYRLS